MPKPVVRSVVFGDAAVFAKFRCRFYIFAQTIVAAYSVQTFQFRVVDNFFALLEIGFVILQWLHLIAVQYVLKHFLFFHVVVLLLWFSQMPIVQFWRKYWSWSDIPVIPHVHCPVLLKMQSLRIVPVAPHE